MAQPSDHKYGRPGLNSQNFLFYKTRICLQKKSQISRFLLNFKDKVRLHDAELTSFLLRENVPKFQHFAALVRVAKQMCPSVGMI